MKAKSLIPLMLLSYLPPAMLLLGPWIGLPAVHPHARKVQILYGVGMMIVLTLWNVKIYLSQKSINEVIAVIRARGPIGYLDTATGTMHYYTEEEKKVIASQSGAGKT